MGSSKIRRVSVADQPVVAGVLRTYMRSYWLGCCLVLQSLMGQSATTGMSWS